MNFKHELAMFTERTGSREICNPAPTNTDEDWLVYVLPENWRSFTFDMALAGYEFDGSEPKDMDASKMPDSFLSFSKNGLNVIATCDFDFYKKFLAATRVAKRFNLLHKSDRILLFQAVLYANG